MKMKSSYITCYLLLPIFCCFRCSFDLIHSIHFSFDTFSLVHNNWLNIFLLTAFNNRCYIAKTCFDRALQHNRQPCVWILMPFCYCRFYFAVDCCLCHFLFAPVLSAHRSRLSAVTFLSRKKKNLLSKQVRKNELNERSRKKILLPIVKSDYLRMDCSPVAIYHINRPSVGIDYQA